MAVRDPGAIGSYEKSGKDVVLLFGRNKRLIKF